MKRVLLTTAAVLTVAFPAFAQDTTSAATPKWDVQNPTGGAQRDVNINVDEGSGDFALEGIAVGLIRNNDL